MLSATSIPSPNLCRTSFRIKASNSSAWPSRPMAAAAAAAAPSLYDVLGLSRGANRSEIKTAYRKLARSCHPDVCKGAASSSSADEFMRIHAAYSTLSDPNKRADYDRGLVVYVGGQQRRWTAHSQSFRGYGRRTWETDQCW